MFRIIAKGSRLVAMVGIAAVVLAGCTTGTTPEGSIGDTSLFMGELPAPATIPKSPHLPPMPLPPTKKNDYAALRAYNDHMQKYSTLTQTKEPITTAHLNAINALAPIATAGGEDAVAAWETLLVTAGIAVAGVDGNPISVNGDTGSGWPMTDAELRAHTALAAQSGGLVLTDLAAILAPTFGTTADALTAELHTELYTIPDHDFAVVFNAFGFPFIQDGTILPDDQVVLSWAQVELLLRRMSMELAVKGDVAASSMHTGPAADDIAAVAFRSPGRAQASHRPCEVNADPWGSEILNQFNKSFAAVVFDGTIGHLEKAGVEVAGKLATALTWARTIGAYATFLAKITSLTASYSLSNSPLVRTKDTQPGEVRDLKISYDFNAGKWNSVRECFNLFLAPLGIEIPGDQLDKPAGMDVTLMSDLPGVLRIGDGTGTSTVVDSGTTGSDGAITFTVSGAPQPDRIPDQANPKDVVAGVRARNDIKSSDFFKDIASAPWDAMDAAGSLGLSLIPELLSRTQFITTKSTVPVRDWKLNADFQVTAFGEFTERNAYNEQPATMCGHTPPLHEEVVTGVATFASDPVNVTAQLISNPKGNIGDQAFVFSTTGTDPSLTDIGQGNGIEMFSMPVSYSTEKTDASPGTGDKPQRFNQKASGGCAAGGGYDSGPKRDPDCGVRTYDSTLNVTMPKARHLYVAGEQSSEFNLWKNCGATLYPYEPPVVPAIQSCDSPTVSGGDVPSITDIFDNGKKHLEVTGALTCSLETNGYLQQLKYSWTLDFCRIEDGKADC